MLILILLPPEATATHPFLEESIELLPQPTIEKDSAERIEERGRTDERENQGLGPWGLVEIQLDGEGEEVENHEGHPGAGVDHNIGNVAAVECFLGVLGHAFASLVNEAFNCGIDAVGIHQDDYENEKESKKNENAFNHTLALTLG